MKKCVKYRRKHDYGSAGTMVHSDTNTAWKYQLKPK